MPETGDAFGELLRAHHAGAHSYEVQERDDGWIAPMGDVGTYFTEPSASSSPSSSTWSGATDRFGREWAARPGK